MLKECELRMYKSVAFPAIGTGLCFLGRVMRAVMGVVQNWDKVNSSDVGNSRLVRELCKL